MAFDTEIMTAAEVRTLALEKTNFEESLLNRYILPAQRQYLKSFLSVDYYDELLTQIAGASLTADNTIAVEDFLKPALAYFVVCDAFHTIRVNVSSKGVMINEAQQSDPADRGDAASVRDHFSSYGSRWLKDLDEYIREQRELDDTKYPLYKSSCKAPSIGKGKGSLYLPD